MLGFLAMPHFLGKLYWNQQIINVLESIRSDLETAVLKGRIAVASRLTL